MIGIIRTALARPLTFVVMAIAILILATMRQLASQERNQREAALNAPG